MRASALQFLALAAHSENAILEVHLYIMEPLQFWLSVFYYYTEVNMYRKS